MFIQIYKLKANLQGVNPLIKRFGMQFQMYEYLIDGKDNFSSLTLRSIEYHGKKELKIYDFINHRRKIAAPIFKRIKA